MSLTITDPKVERAVAELAQQTGLSVEDALYDAVSAKLDQNGAVKKKIDWEKVREIQDRVAALPVLDDRTPEEMLYDENGLPY